MSELANDLELGQRIPISIRISPGEAETLDRLVIACRAYYERQAKTFPPAARMAQEVTRSSALRDLLLAWKHDCCDQFSRDITKKVDH